jgi:hypothetical protein
MPSQGLSYTLLPSSIHELRFHDVHISTLVSFEGRMKAIIETMSDDEILRIVLYIPAVPSIQHMINVARDLRKQRSSLPPGRIAIIYNSSLQLSLLNLITRAAVRTSTLRLFHSKDEQQALKWVAE